jgi:hypothetical protein
LIVPETAENEEKFNQTRRTNTFVISKVVNKMHEPVTPPAAIFTIEQSTLISKASTIANKGKSSKKSGKEEKKPKLF